MNLLIQKGYPAFLADYHQVEFIAPREVLRETALLQQIVIYLEVRLARHALSAGRGDWRHALVLLHYGQEGPDHEGVAAALRQGVAEGCIGPQLLEPYGLLPAEVGRGLAAAEERPEPDGGGAEVSPGLETSSAVQPAIDGSEHEVAFDEFEARRIEVIVRELVRLQGEQPLFFNPEDYEHELHRRLQAMPESPLFEIRERCQAAAADQLLWAYQRCYRDVIDGSLHWEVLTQHHAPELKELFAGDGLRRLQALAGRCVAASGGALGEESAGVVLAELERYLTERCLPAFPQNPMFYLEYFRTWVAPELIREAVAPQEAG